MESRLILTFLISSMIIVAIPGPNIILVINDSIKYGFKNSILTIAGIKLGVIVLSALSLSGLTALLTLFSSVFTFIKWAGVIYLLFLGINQIMTSFRRKESTPVNSIQNNNLFLKGFLVSLTNPKGLLFSAAFFPQFIDNQLAVAPQIILLACSFLILSTLIEMIYAVAGNTAGKLIKSDNFKKITDCISGTFMLFFGIGLIFVKEKN